MKNFSNILEKSIEFEKLAQKSPYDDPNNPYDDPMTSQKAKKEVSRINKLISKIRSNLDVFLDAVSLSDGDDVYGDASDRENAQMSKRKVAQLISKLSAVGRQWMSDINTSGIGFKASQEYIDLMQSIVSQIKSIPAPRGKKYLELLEPLTWALQDFNPSMMGRSSKEENINMPPLDIKWQTPVDMPPLEVTPSGKGRAKPEEEELPQKGRDVVRNLVERDYGSGNYPSFEADWRRR